MRNGLVVLVLMVGTVVAAQQPANPRQQPGASITMFAPEQHDLYDGHYILSANRIYMVGGLNDPVGWDHLDNDAKTVKPVAGTAEIDVNDLTNTGKFEVRLKIPEGDLVLAIDKFNEFNPCQNGGIVGFLHEHGTDSGCGDNNWPKTFVFLAGWGFGHATLNGKPLYDNYEMHFMITQGIRDRKTLRVNYPMANKKQPAGEVNPATQQIDFYIRSPQQNPKNKPNSRGLHALLRDGGHVEVTARRPHEVRRLQLFVCAVAVLVAGVMGQAVPMASQAGTDNPKGSKPPTILFMCPHGAAKSVLASAYFQRLAKERGLNVHVASAGTEPDASVSPAVAAHLKGQGYAVPAAKPRKVAPEEFASADVVVSIGCDLAALPQPRGKLVRWDEVPALSDDFTAADEAIRKRVTDLVEELLRSMPKPK